MQALGDDLEILDGIEMALAAAGILQDGEALKAAIYRSLDGGALGLEITDARDFAVHGHKISCRAQRRGGRCSG